MCHSLQLCTDQLKNVKVDNLYRMINLIFWVKFLEFEPKKQTFPTNFWKQPKVQLSHAVFLTQPFLS